MMNASGIIIPEGFKYVLGTENTGFTIEDFNGNQFVWIPGGDTIEDGACEGFFISRYEVCVEGE